MHVDSFSDEQLCSLLLATGLARLHWPLQQFQIVRNLKGWDIFWVEQSLNCYFIAMSVNNKRHHWIGVGVESKKKKAVLLVNARKKVDTPLSPGTQSISLFFSRLHPGSPSLTRHCYKKAAQ
jgi:hypothetical protein